MHRHISVLIVTILPGLGCGSANAPTEPSAVVEVSVGVGMECARRADGSVTCSGDTRGPTEAPAPPYIAVAAGQRFACALRAGDRGLDCWGAADSPVLDVPTGAFAKVSAGTHHACAVTLAGDATCWGHDFTGELAVPTGAWRAIEAGELQTCGVRDDGLRECWGVGMPRNPTS